MEWKILWSVLRSYLLPGKSQVRARFSFAVRDVHISINCSSSTRRVVRVVSGRVEMSSKSSVLVLKILDLYGKTSDRVWFQWPCA